MKYIARTLVLFRCARGQGGTSLSVLDLAAHALRVRAAVAKVALNFNKEYVAARAV